MRLYVLWLCSRVWVASGCVWLCVVVRGRGWLWVVVYVVVRMVACVVLALCGSMVMYGYVWLCLVTCVVVFS